MSISVRELGTGGEVLADQVTIDSASLDTMTLDFHLNKNYSFMVNLHGLPFLSTTILASQIQQASTDNVLNIGAMNAITTYLTGLLEQQLIGSRYLSKARMAGNTISGNALAPNADELIIHDFMTQNFTGAITNFSSLSYVNLENGSVQTTELFNQRKNRINLLRLYANKVYTASTPTATQFTAMKSLYNAFFDETNVSTLLSKLTDPTLPVLDAQGDQGVSLMAELAARDASQQFLFLSGNGVLTPDELRQVFFTPQQAFNSLLLEMVVSTPESLVVGSISGNGRSGTTVTLQPTGTNLILSTTSDANGQFRFASVPTGSYQLLAQQSGYFFSGNITTTQIVSANVLQVNVAIQSYAIADHLSPELEWSGNQLRIKSNSITSSHLAQHLQISGNLVVPKFSTPTYTLPTLVGQVGQVFLMHSTGNAQWSALPAGGFSGNYVDLSGQPILFSGNYSDLTGVPTVPSTANVMASNVASTITANWDNSAQPWSDGEVSDQLTLVSANISGVNISGDSANFSTLTVTGSSNLSGLILPSTSGTAGQWLQTQGNGHLSWVTPATYRSLPTLASGQMVMGNASGVAVASTPTGDASVAESGVVTINANAMGNAEITDSSITSADLAPNLTFAGNLGASTLAVNGASNFSGVMYPNAVGSNGQILKLGSAGNLYWATDEAGLSISANAINSSELGDQSVGNVQLATGAVTSDDVLDGSLTVSDFTPSITLTGNASVAGQLTVTGASNLSGVLLPSATGSTNQVLINGGSGNMVWKTVDVSLLSAGTISGNEIAANAVTSAQITDASVTSAALATNAITTSLLATDSVGASEVATDAVGNDELQNTIALTHLTVSANTTLGTSLSDNVVVASTLTASVANAGNIWWSANVVPASNTVQLGSVTERWSAVVADDVISGVLRRTGANLNMDVNADALPELVLTTDGKLGLGTSAPSTNLHVAGNMKVEGLMYGTVLTVSANAALGNESTVLVDTSSTNITLTLPLASSRTGQTYAIKKINRDNGWVRVVASDNIDGASSVFLKNSAGVLPSLEVVSDGNTWYVTERNDGTTEPQGGYMLVDVSGGPAAPSYPVSYTNTVPDLTGTGNLTYKGNVIVLKWIEPGRFTMGNTTVGGDAVPEHPVVLTEGFWAGVFEVTQQQWLNVMAQYPLGAGTQNYGDAGAKAFPVHLVSWEDIRGASATYNWPSTSTVGSSTFMGNLLAKTGLPFDLPTEAEWEYTCRAGTITEWSFGSGTATDYEWDNTNAGGAGHEVGGKLPNPWGLYDMHGNVLEWCRDWLGAYPTSSEQSDPNGANAGSARINRGGKFNSSATDTRSAYRGNFAPASRNDRFGLRLFMRPR